MKLYIVLFDKPWKTIIVTSVYSEAITAYKDGPKAERRLMLGWDIVNGVEIFQAELSYLNWTAMQARPIGISILNSEDLYGLSGLLQNELFKIITHIKTNFKVEMLPIVDTEEKAA